MRREAASLNNYFEMSESIRKHRKRYEDNQNNRFKNTYLIHVPGNSSDEFKVLRNFGSRYTKISPTKDCNHDLTTKNKFKRHQNNNAIVNHKVC